MIKEVPLRFQKFLGPFNMLALEPCSDMALLSDSFNQVLDTR